jgi:hypothetical protein
VGKRLHLVHVVAASGSGVGAELTQGLFAKPSY